MNMHVEQWRCKWCIHMYTRYTTQKNRAEFLTDRLNGGKLFWPKNILQGSFLFFHVVGKLLYRCPLVRYLVALNKTGNVDTHSSLVLSLPLDGYQKECRNCIAFELAAPYQKRHMMKGLHCKYPNPIHGSKFQCTRHKNAFNICGMC